MGGINYYKWAFRFTIWMVIIHIVMFFSILNFNSFLYDEVGYMNGLNNFGILSLVLFVAAVVFLIIGFVKNQPQKYHFWIALLLCIGYLLNVVLGLVSIS